MCVLMDTHGRPVCADGNHGCPMCTKQTATWAKITRTVHGKGQCDKSMDQRSDMCTDGQPQTSYKAMDVLCGLTDTHGCPVCTKQTATWAKITRTVHG
ncbi:unnamed protein product [Brassica rapa]|uniref:Uncharacterized protein n=1 Tax=Brassica campestris TaxID=3711 RepID=A0A8D9FZF2_BRACM|nr:unnamed protein product [Brassica rapa]